MRPIMLNQTHGPRTSRGLRATVPEGGRKEAGAERTFFFVTRNEPGRPQHRVTYAPAARGWDENAEGHRTTESVTDAGSDDGMRTGQTRRHGDASHRVMDSEDTLPAPVI